MAYGAVSNKFEGKSSNHLYCPMIDARRMEVYTALFDQKLNEIRETKAEIVNESFLKEYRDQHPVVFFGNGSSKCRDVIGHPNAVFLDDFQPSATSMADLVYRKYCSREFEDVAYFEPFYLKDFIAGIPKVKGLS
jgi:tRNA threonylcarbamoyladenosine biosynthesis protein TsaB